MRDDYVYIYLVKGLLISFKNLMQMFLYTHSVGGSSKLAIITVFTEVPTTLCISGTAAYGAVALKYFGTFM